MNWRLDIPTSYVLPLNMNTANESILDQAKNRLAESEIRTRELRGIVQSLESAQKRFNALQTGGSLLRAPRMPALGLTRSVVEIFQTSPTETFTPSQIRKKLIALGVDTKPRTFGSSLSTLLTRLGARGIITINREGDARTFQWRQPE